MPMTHQERALKTFAFEPTDRVPCDLMESVVWPELLAQFTKRHGLSDAEAIHDFLDTDFRWLSVSYEGPPQPPPAENLPDGWGGTYSDALYQRRLAHAKSVADVEAHEWPDPSWWQPPDFAAARARWPEHALVVSPGWAPLFCSACDALCEAARGCAA